MKKLTLSAPAKDRYLTYGIIIIATIVVQAMLMADVTTRFFEGLLVPTCYMILAAISLNLVVGISGELSLGQAGFMCVGAYVGSLFSVISENIITNSYLRFPLALLIGGVVAAIFGFIIGIPVLRLRGDYLAIVTLAFGEIIKSIFGNIYLATDKNGLFLSLGNQGYINHEFDSATKVVYIEGAQGLYGTPSDSSFLICMIVIFIAMVVMLNFIDSKQGRAVMAARDNRIAAEAMGVNVTRAKMTAFVMSAFFAGIAGVLYSHNLSTLTAVKFDYNLSIQILVFVVLGGMTKMRNVMIATVILYVLPEALRGLQSYRMLMYAIVLIVMMIVNNSATAKKVIELVSSKIKALFSRKKAADTKEGGAE